MKIRVDTDFRNHTPSTMDEIKFTVKDKAQGKSTREMKT